MKTKIETRYRLEKRILGGRNWVMHRDRDDLEDIEFEERWLVSNGWDTQIFKYEVVTITGSFERYRETKPTNHTGR